MRHVKTFALMVAASVAMGGAACGPKGPAGELPLCKAEVAGSEAEEVAGGAITADIWFLIMLKNFDRNTMTVKSPTQDCTGRPIEPKAEAVDACVAGEDPPKPLPERPLTEDDLLVAPLEDGRQLVWIKTGWYDNGEAVGPIGIAEFNSKGIAIRAIGTLRAQADRAAMRLETTAQGQVLVLESRRCDPDDPKTCARMVRLLPLQGDNFVEMPLKGDDGACFGAAQVTMFEEHNVTLDNGIERSFEVARSVEFDEGTVAINEQVTIKDQDPTQPDSPATVFRRANVSRKLAIGTESISTERGLWDQMIAEHGTVVVKEREPEPEGDTASGDAEASPAE